MTETATPPAAPTDLMVRSKEKYVLSQARLRRGALETALLSLHGSLADGLRAYLLLHRQPEAAADWPAMLAALGTAEQPLTPDEAAQVQRIHRLWERITSGEAVTLPAANVAGYQQLVSGLLRRYGVVVAVPDEDSSPLRLALLQPEAPRERQRRWWGVHLNRVFVLVLAVVCLLGTATTLAVQQGAAGLPLPGAAGETLPSTTPPARLTVGSTALVVADAGEQVPLQVRPGSSADIPVRLYVSAGTAVQVVAGPLARDGGEWWRVRVFNQEGWCRGEVLQEYQGS
jgi:hypothetical protein